MKNKTSVLFALALLVSLLALPALSQPQEQKFQRFAVWEIVAKPSQAPSFEAAVKKEIELGPLYAWDAYSTEDYHYYFLTPIDNFAGIDSLNKMDNDWMSKLGDKFPELMKGFAGTYEYYRFGVIRQLPELSYAPKIPTLKPEEVKYMFWGMASVEVGKEKEYEDLWRQWVELFKSKDCSMAFTNYFGEMGTEMPLYFWAVGGKSTAEFWVEDEKVSKMLGDKAQALWKKTLACLRKYEYKTGMPRPDLSSMPKAK